MHPIQEKLLKLIGEKNIGSLTLREIGGLIGESLPQKIKHHLSQLERKGFILIDRRKELIRRVNTVTEKNGGFLISIPILGAANCGPATLYADQNIEGYLKISKRLIPHRKSVFAIKAEGNSMNKSQINGKSIEDGDFVIIDSTQIDPNNNDYVVSIIDGMANIKKFRFDKENSRIALTSESTQDYPPIFIHESDNYKINGKVVDVVKAIR